MVCLLVCILEANYQFQSSVAELGQPCRTAATWWGESIRHSLKAGKSTAPPDWPHCRDQCVCLCGARPNLVCLITHTRACKQLWQVHAETQLTRDKHTQAQTHTPPIALIGTVCAVFCRISVWASVCESLFFPSFFFFFQAAISARPCHLFSMLWNTALPLAAGVLTWWQKLSIGVKKESTQDRSDSGYGLGCLSRRLSHPVSHFPIFLGASVCVFATCLSKCVFIFISIHNIVKVQSETTDL